MKKIFFYCFLFASTLYLSGCNTVPASNVKSNAQLSPASRITLDLVNLPKPKDKIAVAVYAFRDQTGQYKPSPDSSYSTSVTQGAASLLVKALNDSGWYTPVEREGLQNLLTERKIVRAIESTTEKGKPAIYLPGLMPASLIIEGGVIAYESNVRTGGKGANYLGIGANDSYRIDQVTVNLRMVDIRSGQVLDTVSVTKTIYSYQFNSSIYAFVSYQRLLQEEAGFTTNEPAQLAVREAIESAVIHLTAQGVRDRLLTLESDEDINAPVIQAYLKETQESVRGVPTPENAPNIGFTERSAKNQLSAVRPLMPQAADPTSLKISTSLSPPPEKTVYGDDSSFSMSAAQETLR